MSNREGFTPISEPTSAERSTLVAAFHIAKELAKQQSRRFGADGDDAVGTVMARFAAKPENLPAEPHQLESYVRISLRNAMFTEKRRISRRGAESLDHLFELPDGEAVHGMSPSTMSDQPTTDEAALSNYGLSGLVESVNGITDDMPEAMQFVLPMVLGDVTIDQMAEELNISKNLASKRGQRAAGYIAKRVMPQITVVD